MLFDLQGRRKTAIKAIYLSLAILMGGGLVLFGVGSDVQGGIADLFTGSRADDGLKEEVEKSSAALRRDPKNPKLIEELIANRYTYAGSQDNWDQEKQAFTADGKEQLKFLSNDWLRYIKSVPEAKRDAETASYAVQAYIALEDYKGAQKAQRIASELEPNSINYLLLAQLAISNGDSLVFDAAKLRAKELAPMEQRDEVVSQIQELDDAAKERATAIQKQIQEQLASPQGGNPLQPFGGGVAPAAPGGN